MSAVEGPSSGAAVPLSPICDVRSAYRKRSLSTQSRYAIESFSRWITSGKRPKPYPNEGLRLPAVRKEPGNLPVEVLLLLR